jgi:hypothetical protein
MNKEDTFAAVPELVKKTNEETMNMNLIKAAEREKTARWYTDHRGKPTNEKGVGGSKLRDGRILRTPRYSEGRAAGGLAGGFH